MVLDIKFRLHFPRTADVVLPTLACLGMVNSEIFTYVEQKEIWSSDDDHNGGNGDDYDDNDHCAAPYLHLLRLLSPPSPLAAAADISCKRLFVVTVSSCLFVTNNLT